MKLLILGLIGWLSVISCQEDPPTTVDVVTEEKDINDDNVSDADESASEDVVDPNSDGYIEGVNYHRPKMVAIWNPLE